jgi:hypothetical protein
MTTATPRATSWPAPWPTPSPHRPCVVAAAAAAAAWRTVATRTLGRTPRWRCGWAPQVVPAAAAAARRAGRLDSPRSDSDGRAVIRGGLRRPALCGGACGLASKGGPSVADDTEPLTRSEGLTSQ